MKKMRFALSLGMVTGLPVMAIEPPVAPEPIPPRATPAPTTPPPRATPAPAEVDEALPAPKAIAQRPYLGVILEPVPSVLAAHLKLAEGEGMVIGELVAGGPAETAGLLTHDILLDVNGTVVGSRDEVRRQVENHQVGDALEFGVIQGGERKKLEITLGAAPAVMQGGKIPRAWQGQNASPEGLESMLEGLPDEHADAVRRMLEMGQRQGDQLGNSDLASDMHRRMMQRMRQQMSGKVDFGFDAEMQSQSTIRLLDEQGSIEMSSRNGSRQLRVFGTDGELVWEGPYDTDEDKAAMPEDVRERVERLSFGMEDGKMQFRFGGREGFRRFDAEENSKW